jgi:hypothetical protein
MPQRPRVRPSRKPYRFPGNQQRDPLGIPLQSTWCMLPKHSTLTERTGDSRRRLFEEKPDCLHATRGVLRRDPSGRSGEGTLTVSDALRPRNGPHRNRCTKRGRREVKSHDRRHRESCGREYQSLNPKGGGSPSAKWGATFESLPRTGDTFNIRQPDKNTYVEVVAVERAIADLEKLANVSASLKRVFKFPMT